MTLLVEDGSKVAGAESYASVSDADTYHSSRGNTLWATMSTEEKEQALRRACEYMSGIYRSTWKGTRQYLDQSLDWPRYNVQVEDLGIMGYWNIIPLNSVPKEVKNANSQLAFLAAQGDLNPPISQGIVKETIGPITTVYDTSSPQNPRNPAISAMLLPYLKSSGGGIARLARC